MVVWSLIMAWLLLSPGSPELAKHFFEGQDKVAHFGLFLGWSFLMTLRALYTWSSKQVILLVAVISILLGAGTEVLQGLIPNRSKDLFDFLADVVGASLGVLFALLFKRLMRIQ